MLPKFIWGEEQADNYYVAGLWNRFEEISQDSGRWRYRHDLFPNCQLATQGKHVILFRQGNDVLEVVRLLHSAMDFPRHFGDESA